MNIELRFLQKAIDDKNYISFFYEDKKYDNAKALLLSEKKGLYLLKTATKEFKFEKIEKLKILKNRF